FKKSTSFQVFHNANIRPDYAIGGEIICNLNGYEALELKNKIIAEAKEAYEKNKKPKAPSFKAKSYEWSLVVNLKPES
ncbi:mobilization protein, partial [Campylobacter helveticus]|nr:mobilization protein [Campylobacter helveticus]